MAVETSSLISDVFKTQYPIALCNTIVRHNWLLSRLVRKKKKSPFGEKIVVPHKTRGNVSATVVLERGALPTATTRLFARTEVTPVGVYQPIDLSGWELDTSKDGGAFIDLLVDATTDGAEALNWWLDKSLWGNGSGRICAINGTPSHSGGYSTVYITPGATGNIFHFTEGQLVTAGTDDTGYEVSSFDVDNDKIIFVGDVTGEAQWADTNYLYRYGSYDAGLDLEPVGIDAHISDANPPNGTYQGVDRTAQGKGFTHAYVKGSAGDNTLISTHVLRDYLNGIYVRGKKVPSEHVCASGVYNSWIRYLESQHQNVTEVVDELGNAARVAYVYNGRRIYLEERVEAPEGEIISYEPDYLQIYEAVPLGWLTDLDNSTRFKLKPGYHIYQGYLYWIFNLVGIHNKCFGRFKGIKEDAIS